MGHSARLAYGVATLALISAATASNAQSPATSGTASSGTSTVKEVVVTGVRASLMSAQKIKEHSDQIVDSIVAEDIGKLPDVSVSDALQRITGVQITRDYGDGGQVTVRGLPQVQTTLNGHEVFTASAGRGLNPEDVPAELVAGLDVYKTPKADQIEGGLGGTIDVRTHKPFDFAGLEASGTVTGNYDDLAGKVTPDVSALVSNRWSTPVGDVGALVSYARQDRSFRTDLSSIGVPVGRTDLIPGKTVAANTGTYDVVPVGERQRNGLDVVFQWRPSQELEFYAEANATDYRSNQTQTGASVNTTGLTATGPVTLFPGTNDIEKVTYLNAPLSVLGFTYDTKDKNRQFNVGGKWNRGDLTVTGDISRTTSTGSVLFSDVQFDTILPTFTQNFSTTIPSSTWTGVNLLDPSAYHYTIDSYIRNLYTGDETAAQFDVKYRVESGPIKSVKFGLRYADRGATYAEAADYQYINGYPGSGPNVSAVPGLAFPTPYTDFFSSLSGGAPLLSSYLVPNVAEIRADPKGVRSKLGLSPTLPSVNPLSTFNVDEKTTAGYAMVNYAFDLGLPVDGNIGVRVIGTNEDLKGFQTLPSGAVGPIQLGNSYIDALPSLNLRVKIQPNLFWRFAASKSLTRPDFSQLSPTLTLNPAFLSGAAGNPNLQPLRANQFDTALEWYFSRTGSVYMTGFYKEVNGFIETVGVQEQHYGQTYTVTRPENGNGGKIKGIELGYQQFYDFLPGPLSGLGMQANYTYVDSSAPSSVVGQTTTLPQLSRNSFNLVGMYEKGPISARLAYNWRDQYFQRIYVGGAGVGIIPIYNGSYGWLDASVTYKVNEHLSLLLEGSNLLQTNVQSYYAVQTLPNQAEIDDRQISFGARFKW